MSKKMLIDASHPEETRVVIVDGTRVEELDYESENKRLLRGNVYLARVTRVEPSLQAAFVEYGGNRHGFLAFSEIHPDYYQIPLEDRQALLEAEQAASLEDDEDEDKEEEAKEKKAKAAKTKKGRTKTKKDDDSDDNDDDIDLDAIEAEVAEDDDDDSGTAPDNEDDDDDSDDAADASEKEVEEEQTKMLDKRRKRQSRRRYKIQEVVKRGQILLIQAVKEERGNKGAAMTTYLSLAGRYCVLMPNTPRGGGISRKIANGSDRKRLKSVMSELSVPQGMGVIVRTAGAKRTKVEIKRDYDYLSRLWDTIRDKTLKSIAPALIHEEGNLVKRSIRDLYGKDIDNILVQGDEAYRMAKDFIKMLMPSHAKNVQPYKDEIPLFLRYQVEKQIEACLDPVAQLKSGGYLVIHPTEALVSVDVNSGRSTKERNVERTALKTNLEAAEEVARQMRLRDLAGLVVIDFIDMDENRNNRAVEKKMKEVLSRDRARVQNSRISQFGLMEISRQRRRRSLLEGSTASCEHCHGVGRKRSIESSALKAVRAVEEEGIRGRAKRIRLSVAPAVAFYLINEKRELLQRVETQFDMFTEVLANPDLIRPEFDVTRLETNDAPGKDPLEAIAAEHRKNHQQNRKRKPKPNQNSSDKPKEARNEEGGDDDENKPKRKRRRGRRGGRGRRNNQQNSETVETANTEEPSKSGADTNAKADTPSDDKSGDTKTGDVKPKPKRRTRAKKADAAKDPQVEEQSTGDTEKPKRKRRSPRKKVAETDAETTPQADADTKAKPTRKRAAPKKVADKVAGKDTKPAGKAKAAAKPKTTAKPKAAAKPKTKATAAPKAAAKPKSTAKAKAKTEAKPKAEPKAKKVEPKAKPKTEAKPKANVKTSEETASKSKKKGWWQKRNPFG